MEICIKTDGKEKRNGCLKNKALSNVSNPTICFGEKKTGEIDKLTQKLYDNANNED